MSSTTTNVGIRLTLDGVQQVESGLGRVQALAGGAAKTLAGLAAGTFSAAAFTSWIKGAIDAADETNKLAQKTGLLTEQVAGLKLAFEQGGVGDSFGPAMAKLAKEAAEGNKAFAAMGVSVTDASGKLKSTRDLIGELAGKFAGYQDGAEKTALAMQIFGRAGADLIPVLNGGSAALDAYDQKAKALGLTMSGEMAAAAEKFNDDLDLLTKYASGAAISIANTLLPTINDLSAALMLAVQHGNGVIGVLKLFGSTTYSTKGFNLAGDLRKSREELDDLTKSRERYVRANSDTSGLDQAIASERKRLEYLKELQRMTMGFSSSDQSDAESRRLGLTTAGRAVAPRVDTSSAARAASGRSTAADKAAAEAAREAAEARKRDFEVIKLRNEAVAKMWEQEQEAAQKAIDAMADVVEQRQAAAAGVLAQVESQRQANAEYGLEGIALVELQNARLLDAAAALDRRAALAQDIDLSGAMSEAYKAEAEGLRDLAAARLSGAAQRQQVDEIKRQKREYEQMWAGVEGFAESAFMDIALNGEDAFKRIGESIQREILQALYEMTVKKWIVNIAAQYGGAGGIGGNSSLLTTAAQSYMSGGSALGASANAVGAYASGTMSGANAYGSIYANATGTGIDGLLATNGAYGTASGSAAGASSASWISAVGYVALIAAAVMVAENLYSKGYNREAVGYASNGGTVNRFGNTSFTTSQDMGRSFQYDSSFERFKAQTLEWAGLSEKWVDILSGTTRMAATFGRKLGAYGFEANVAGGDADVTGFARYKGGLFRSNKTVGVDIDQRDAAAFDAIVESTIEGSRAMARAMGYSSEAIDNYTGKIRVNMKGADTAAEQSERMAKAMDDLQFSLLKAASGGKYSREEFERLMEGVRQSMEAVGISTSSIADIIVQGMTGRLSRADVGAQLSEVIIGGIYDSIASNYAGMIAQAFTSQIIAPIFTALAAGVPISQAISQSAIQNVVATAQAAAQALNAIFSSAEFMGAINGIQTAISGVAGAATSVRAPSFRAPTRVANTGASDAAREREQLERELLRLQGKTAELRQRELRDIAPGNRALQQRIWLLEDEQAVTNERNDLERQRMEILEDTVGLRKLERDALAESNRALYDEIQALKEAADLKNVWRDLTDSIEEEVKRIRGQLLGDSDAGLAYVQAQFATATAQARAMNQEAAGLLPDLAGRLVELYETSAGSRSEFDFQVNSVLASLEQTNRITRDLAGVNDTAAEVEDKALAKKVALLQASIDALQATMERNTASAQTSADALKKASTGGGLRVVVTQ